jgi:hypothetical protein
MAALLERVAMHQTRLRVPGVSLDTRAIALGVRGLLLCQSMDRLVALLAILSETTALEAVARSLKIEVVRSQLGLRELLLSFDADSSERMDQFADAARLVGAFAFTGTSRHFVQYRDRLAPFGYDAPELLVADAPYLLYHSTFSQAYEVDRALELKRLVAWLELRQEARTQVDAGPLWVLAAPGVGRRLASHLCLAGISARATVIDVGDGSSWLFRIESLAPRLRAIVGSGVPGVLTFRDVAPGVAVELGYRHPLELKSLGCFDPKALVLFRASSSPLAFEKLPLFAPVDMLIEFSVPEQDVVEGRAADTPDAISVSLQLEERRSDGGSLTGLWVDPSELVLLRRLAYFLPATTVRSTRLAMTEAGAFLHHPSGVDAIPIGRPQREFHPRLFVPNGFSISPAVQPSTAFRAFGAPTDRVLLLRPNARTLAIRDQDFVPLERALLTSTAWTELATLPIAEVEKPSEPSTVWLEPLRPFAVHAAKKQ